MSMKFLLSFGLLAGSVLWAADPYTPLDVKTGTWETTMTTGTSGALPIPPEALARLTPEQRAKMEAVLGARANQAPRSITSRSCLKKEDIEKPLAFNNDQKACKPTIVSSSRTKTEVQVDCSQNQVKSTGTVTVEALNSETVKITSQMAMTNGGNTMNMTMNGTSKWIGSACTDAK
jgi:hypothetical protein